MIEKSHEELVKELDSELIKVAIIESPGTIMMGLGLYGKFGAEGEAFHPLLDNPNIVNGLLVVGGSIILWGMNEFFRVAKRKKELHENKNI